MAAKGRGGLGRGLSALIDDVSYVAKEAPAAQTEEKPAEGLLTLSVDMLKPNAKQPRKHFDEEKIRELADSIKEHGLLQPIMVRTAGKGYEIVAGERRWRAARAAGLKEVPCLLRELNDEQNLLVAIIENLQREGLDPIEEAAAFQNMIDSFGLTQEEAAKSVGKSRPYVTNALRLLRLPEEIRTMISEGQLSSGHARALMSISDADAQVKAAKQMAEEGWSVRAAEEFAAKGKNAKKRPAKRSGKAREVQDLEEELKRVLGTKVEIKPAKKGGKIIINCYDREELERMIELLNSLK